MTLGSNIESIGEGAFGGCSELNSINLPEAIHTIEGGAFQDCRSLPNLDLPDALLSISSTTFWGCELFTSIVIPDNVTSIGNSAFAYCTALTSVTISENTTYISPTSFQGCPLLVEIIVSELSLHFSSIDGVLFNQDLSTLIKYPSNRNGQIYSIPTSVTSIEVYSMTDLQHIENIIIPKEVVTIGRGAFWGNTNLLSIEVDPLNPNYSAASGVLFDKNQTTLLHYPPARIDEIYEIPETVTAIGESAFAQSTHLTEVLVPETLRTLGQGAFSGCAKLETIELGNQIAGLSNHLFSNCSSLTSFTIPESVQSIGFATFFNCDGFVKIAVPDSVTSIGSLAFSECSSLIEVSLGARIRSVPSEAFKDSENLSTVRVHGEISSYQSDCFAGIDNGAEIILPHYESADAALSTGLRVSHVSPTRFENGDFHVEIDTQFVVPSAKIYHSFDMENWVEIPNTQLRHKTFVVPEDSPFIEGAAGYFRAGPIISFP